jgi:U32 family peptidase
MAIELMSPAGNTESFLAAIENGADSVYLGLKKFNARRPADNFSFYQFKKTIGFAHSSGRKVYLALNTDLKSNELRDAVGYAEFACLNKIDGIIVKDPAMLYVLKKFYDVPIHISTQNAVESSLGVEFLKSSGIKRIVLARELEFNEISECTAIGDIEIEIFAEGSMCFSVSGKCLMSSWVGGRSGNRGACTAPCRVSWQSGGKSATFFSMKDLNLIKELGKLEDVGVAALKIEGRLKNAGWVGAITGIYRTAIDNKTDAGKSELLQNELGKYSARERSTGHFHGHEKLTGSNVDWNDYEKPVTGTAVNAGIFEEENEIDISRKDDCLIVKISMAGIVKEFSYKIPSEPKKGRSSSISEVVPESEDTEISGRKFRFKTDIGELNTSASFINRTVSEIQKEASLMIRNSDLPVDARPEVLEFISQSDLNLKREKKLGDVPDKLLLLPEQIDVILKNNFKVRTIVVSAADEIDFGKLMDLKKRYPVVVSIPPVLFEKDAKEMSGRIGELFRKGIDSFEANSFTGMRMLHGLDCEKRLGIDMGVYNHISARYFKSLGFKSVYCPVEGDSSVYKALSAFSETEVECLVFGRLPLFVSRVDSAEFKKRAMFTDKYCRIECYKQNGLNYFVEKTPFCLVGNKFKNEKISFDSLTCDLRFFDNPASVLKSVFDNRIQDSSDFNFFRRLV